MAARLDALVGRLPSTPRICELNARGAESMTALAAARHATALYDGIIFAASNDSSSIVRVSLTVERMQRWTAEALQTLDRDASPRAADSET